MNRKNIFILSIIFFIILAFCYSIFVKDNRTISYVDKYLNTRYHKEFVFIKTLDNSDSNKSRYLYCTNDDNKINFDVTYWYGPIYTPWGNFPLIWSKHVLDNLPDAIKEHVIKQKSSISTIDMSYITLDEATENIYSLLLEIDKELKEYNISWVRSTAEITIINKGKEYKIKFSMRRKSAIKDLLTQTIYG